MDDRKKTADQKELNLVDILKTGQSDSAIVLTLQQHKAKGGKFNNKPDKNGFYAADWGILLGYPETYTFVSELIPEKTTPTLPAKQKENSSHHAVILDKLKKQSPVEFFRNNVDKFRHSTKINRYSDITNIIIFKNNDLSDGKKKRILNILNAMTGSLAEMVEKKILKIAIRNQRQDTIPLLVSMGCQYFSSRRMESLLESQNFATISNIIMINPYRYKSFQKNVFQQALDFQEPQARAALAKNKNLTKEQQQYCINLLNLGRAANFDYMQFRAGQRHVIDLNFLLSINFPANMPLNHYCYIAQRALRENVATPQQRDQLYAFLGDAYSREFHQNQFIHNNELLMSITNSYLNIQDPRNLSAEKNFLVGDWLASISSHSGYAESYQHYQQKALNHLIEAWEKEKLSTQNLPLLEKIQTRLAMVLGNYMGIEDIEGSLSENITQYKQHLKNLNELGCHEIRAVLFTKIEMNEADKKCFDMINKLWAPMEQPPDSKGLKTTKYFEQRAALAQILGVIQDALKKSSLFSGVSNEMRQMLIKLEDKINKMDAAIANLQHPVSKSLSQAASITTKKSF